MILAVKNLKTRHQGSVARADNIWTFCSCIKCRLKSFLPAHHHYWHHFRVHNFVFNANHESCIIHEQDLKASLSTRLQGIYNSHYGNGAPAMHNGGNDSYIRQSQLWDQIICQIKTAKNFLWNCSKQLVKPVNWQEKKSILTCLTLTNYLISLLLAWFRSYANVAPSFSVRLLAFVR